jgi:heme exporter protein B
MVTAFFSLVRQDLRLALRGGIGSLVAMIFFVIAVSLFPLGFGPDSTLLERVAPVVLWVCALLATMLSLGRMFDEDYEDGSLEVIALGPLPLEAVVLAKVLAHWLTTGLPLMCAAPVLALMLNMSVEGFAVLMIALALGTPILSLVGSVGAALTVGLRRGGVLISLLVLPLYVPVLLFGVGAVEGAIFGLGERAHLLILASGLVISLALTPWASAAALRLALE